MITQNKEQRLTRLEKNLRVKISPRYEFRRECRLVSRRCARVTAANEFAARPQVGANL